MVKWRLWSFQGDPGEEMNVAEKDLVKRARSGEGLETETGHRGAVRTRIINLLFFLLLESATCHR